MGDVLVGTCSWTDPTLIESRKFYPDWAKSAEDRLRFYASQFNIVEVDSSYYAMPGEKTCRLWAERTPEHFLFDVKAFRLFTQHPTPLTALPNDVREALPRSLSEKRNVYQRDMPGELLDELWDRFESALLPLDSTGKLGTVLFQFPPWFHIGSRQMDYIASCNERLKQYRMAVEFRNNSWLAEGSRQCSLEFLRENNLPFVCVDEPQGFKSSVPPVAEATADIACVRFHGRNAANWERRDIRTVERFDWYTQDELAEWVPRIRDLASRTKLVHALFNTNYADQGVVNARQLSDTLGIEGKGSYQLALE